MTYPHGQQPAYPTQGHPPQGYGPPAGHGRPPGYGPPGGYPAQQQGYPPPGYPPQQRRPQLPPPRKRKTWPFVVLGAVVLLVVIGVASQGRDSRTPPAAAAGDAAGNAAPAAAAAPDLDFGQKIVTMSIEGSGQATVSYLKAGGTEQQTVDLPWSSEITVDFVASLTAQRKSGNNGEITCRITEKDGGAVVADSTSSGPYAVVSCGG